MASYIAERSTPAEEIDEILRSKEGSRGFTREEAARLVEFHRSAFGSEPEFDLASEPIVRELSGLQIGTDLAALDRVAHLRQLRRPSAADASSRATARDQSGLEIPFPGCDLVVTPPPYSTGGPLDEQVGVNAIDIPDDTQLAPTSRVSSLAPTGKTFSALALPGAGDLSLGVGLGTIRTSPAFRSVYPPQEQHSSVVVGVPYLLDRSRATGNLLNFTNPIPRAPLEIKSRVNVNVGMTLDGAESFYLVDASQNGSPLIVVQAFGSVDLVVTSSTGRVGKTSVQFLRHEELPNKPVTPKVLRDFSLTHELALAVGTKWISVFVEVRLTVQRLYIEGIEPLPVEDRGGFAMIDLRTPAVPTQQIHPILNAGGPIRVSQLTMTFCPEEIIGQ